MPTISLDEALAIVASRISEPLEIEEVALAGALGRYAAVELRAGFDLPPFASSAMDGYAVRSGDTPAVLHVIGESAAGNPFERFLGPGEAVAISTGAVFPAGADTVVPIERTVPRDAFTVDIPTAQAPLANVRRAGSDVRRDELVISAGMRIGPAQIAAVASLGHDEVACHRRPRVAILTTGSELVPAGRPLRPGEIYNSNGPMLAAAAASAGADLVWLTAVADSADALRSALATALDLADVVLTSGGVSVGPHDLVRKVGAGLGIEEQFWRVALRPGKPTWFGARGETRVFGLPGNPVSALVCFELFVRPALLCLAGAEVSGPAFRAARLASAYQRNPEREQLITVRQLTDGVVEPLSDQRSHQIATLAGADGLARISPGEAELPAGSEVAYLPLA